MLATIIYSELQENLIRSHAAGVGSPLSPLRTRVLMALRINTLAKGFRYVAIVQFNYSPVTGLLLLIYPACTSS